MPAHGNNSDTKGGGFEALAISVLVVFVSFLTFSYIGFIAIGLLPLYKLFKRNNVLGVYGGILFFVGILSFYTPLVEWFQNWYLDYIFSVIRKHLNAHFTGKFMNVAEKGIVFEFQYLPIIFTLVGALCFLKSKYFGDKRTKKINISSGKPISLRKLKHNLMEQIKYGIDHYIYIGRDRETKKDICINDREGHLLCVGATRSGKTSRVLMPTALTDFLHGNAVLNIDPKGSIDTLLSVYKIIKAHGKADKFKVLMLDRPEISIPYNPLSNGNVSQIAARIMRICDWSEPYYKNLCHQSLLKYLLKMKGSRADDGWESIPTLAKIFEIFECENNPNVNSMVANLCDFKYADFADIFNFEKSKIDFLEAQKNGEFVYIVVNTDTYLESSALFIRALLMDLMWCANQIQLGVSPSKFFSIHIDELSDFIHKGFGFESFMKKCGSAGYVLHCYSQSFGDLRDVGLEDMIISNTYNHVILRQNYPLNADLAAKMFGTVKTTIETERTNDDAHTGLKSVREGYELRVDPTLVKELDNGAAIFHNKDILSYVDLAVPPYFQLTGEPTFMTEDEKSNLYKELIAKASDARIELGMNESFEPEKFLLGKQKVLETSKSKNFYKGK